MIIGTMLMKMGGVAYYTPEFPRGGLAGTFCVEVLDLTGGPTVTISVEHRYDTEVSFATAGTFSDITAVGDAQLDVSNLKEIVRLKIEFDAGDAAADAIRLVFQAPSWRPY